MHGGPEAVQQQQQPNRHIHPLAVAAPLGDLKVQDPLLTERSNNKLRTMSEPAPLLHCAPGPVASHAQRWKEPKVVISNTTDVKQNGHCECSSDVDKSSCNHPPASANASEDCSSDLLRMVKHKPSAIVFCDNQVTSDVGESSSSSTEEREDDDDEEDDFPEASQYKEFMVSRRRRNLSRNRKCSRKRQDAQPNGAAASGWQKPTNKGKPESAGSQEEEETLQKNNGEQVRKTRQEASDNKDKEFLFTV